MALKRLTGGGCQPLSSADIETIHQSSLTILENTGDDWEQDVSQTRRLLNIVIWDIDRTFPIRL
jgi:trimethylamine:corrinoid methyltransferase-like protein